MFPAHASVCLISYDGESAGVRTLYEGHAPFKNQCIKLSVSPGSCSRGRRLHYLRHLGGRPYFVPLDCIWHSNQPKGCVIYIHCHFSRAVPPFLTWPRSLCSPRIQQIVCSLSRRSLLTRRAPLLCPLSLKKKKTAPSFLCAWHAEQLQVKAGRPLLHTKPVVCRPTQSPCNAVLFVAPLIVK